MGTVEQPPQRVAVLADADEIRTLAPATEPARAYGFRETDRVMVPLPDGTELAGVAMERPCAPS